MKIVIKTKGLNIFIPLPLGIIPFATKLIPNKILEEIQAQTPEPYKNIISKQTLKLIINDCMDIIKENKGLEVIHVESKDKTLVSITL